MDWGVPGRKRGQLRFGHGGRDQGFDARLIAYAETGQGAAIMINANDNSQMVSRILEAIAREYHWPDDPSSPPSKHPAAEVARKTRRLLGALRDREQSDADARGRRGPLATIVDGFPDEEFLPEADDRFHSAQRDVQVTFLKDGSGEVDGFLGRKAAARGKRRASARCSIR